MLHNAGIVSQLLDAKHRPAESPAARSIEDDLPRIARQQQRVVDLIEGFVATDDLGRMQHEFPTGVGNANPNAMTMPAENPAASTNDLGDAGLPKGPSDIGATGPQSPDQLAFDARSYADGTVTGHTVYDLLARNIDAQRAVVAHAWVAPTATIQSVVPACRAAAPSPAPVAVPPAAP